ncbi:Hypothetical protein CINCED_3A005408 [Cinara cedri]|uniref:Lipase domain-containing protein n=1 Tax=Cinara cedri TaxID=506608 RepID=A0A5E4NAF8_9HEMI|nr:Hypothetical protein CINCED_3A005408 [Cinara cedri]
MPAIIIIVGVATMFVFVVCLPPSHHYIESSKVNTFEELVRGTKGVNALNKHLVSKYFSFTVKDLVTFWLYTRNQSQSGYELVPGDPGTLMSSDFNESKPTKIIIHGWLGNSKSLQSICSNLKFEYFKLGNYNVICIDWTWLALDLAYFTARYRCKKIGNYVAELVLMLTKHTSQDTDDIHIIGFSMGAHIAGYAGKRLNGQIHRITDPAKPLFNIKSLNKRLNKNDAKFVDIIHTTSWVLGQHNPIGNIDFYPNGGNTEQPGCEYNNYVHGEVCSHHKAFQLYARSIRSKDEFVSIKCDGWTKFEESKCNDNPDDYTYLGEYANSSLSGSYYLSVF